MKWTKYIILLPSFVFSAIDSNAVIVATKTVSNSESMLQYGLAGIVILFVIKELIGLVKWLIDRKNGKSNSRDSTDTSESQLLSTIYKKIDDSNREIFERINSLYEEVQDVKLQQAGMPKMLFQEFVNQNSCKERRELCPARQHK